MKNMLVAAITLGVTIAGMILYFGKRNANENKIKNAANDTYNVLNDGLRTVERPGQHAMG